LPRLQIAQTGNATVINWPYSAAGFNLETTFSLDSLGWSSSTDPVEILSGQNFVTNSISLGPRFFRLKFQP
jgi:hypothetical protein